MTYSYHKFMKEGKQMKKRWMSLILTVIMMLSLAGCGRNANLSSVSRDTEPYGSMKRRWRWQDLYREPA